MLTSTRASALRPALRPVAARPVVAARPAAARAPLRRAAAPAPAPAPGRASIVVRAAAGPLER